MTICDQCLGLAMFDENLRLRTMTDEELAAWDPEKRAFVDRLRAMIGEAKRAYRAGEILKEMLHPAAEFRGQRQAELQEKLNRGDAVVVGAPLADFPSPPPRWTTPARAPCDACGCACWVPEDRPAGAVMCSACLAALVGRFAAVGPGPGDG